MAVSKKILQSVQDSVIFGMSPGLPYPLLWIVYAKARRGFSNGWAIIGATSKTHAKIIARSKGWLSTAVITGIASFEEDCKNLKRPTEEVYNELRAKGKLPKEIGEWYELEWGY
jgi:hypothetical protein